MVADAAAEALSTSLGVEHSVLGRDADETRVTVVPASLVKGLEYDSVLVVEPAAIVAGEATPSVGLRRLYVVLTRAVSALSVVHREPLPAELSP